MINVMDLEQHTAGESSSTVTRIDGEGYATPISPVSAYQMRTTLSVPVAERAYQYVIQSLLASPYTLTLPPGKYSDWFAQQFQAQWPSFLKGVLSSIFVGFQVAELVAEKSTYTWLTPIFPNPDYVYLKMEQERFVGFKQVIPGGKTIRVNEASSLLWTWGNLTYGNPYGSGLLQVVYPYVRAKLDIQNNMVKTSRRVHEPYIVFAMENLRAGTDAVIAGAEAIKSSGFFGFELPSGMERPPIIQAIQPPSNALSDLQKAVDYFDRQIALGMLVSLRTFYDSPQDGGSYAMLSIQQSESDKVLEGIMEGIRPGVEEYIVRSLWVNGYGYDRTKFEFSWNPQTDLTMQAARQLFQDIVTLRPDVVDLPKLAQAAKLPVLLEKNPSSRALSAKVEGILPVRGDKADLDKWFADNTDSFRRALTASPTVKTVNALLEKCRKKALATVKSRWKRTPTLDSSTNAYWAEWSKVVITGYQTTLQAALDAAALVNKLYPTAGSEEVITTNALAKLTEKVLRTVYAYYAQYTKAAE